MKKNVGTIDRVIRTVIAVTVGVLYLAGQISGLVAAVLGVLAVIFLLTSVVGSCPLYSLFGISTCAVRSRA